MEKRSGTELISSFAHLFTLLFSVLRCTGPTLSVRQPICNARRHPNLPVTHGSVGRFHDEGLLLALPPQLLDVVLELSVLCGEDPSPGYEVVLLGLALAHSGTTYHVSMSDHNSSVNQCNVLTLQNQNGP